VGDADGRTNATEGDRREAVIACSIATLAVSLGLSGPAWSATANPNASCAGQVGASVAAQPGARAEIAHGFIAETHSEGVHPPGFFQSEWSRLRQPLEGCLEFITP
jgi:hypothetical protein